MSELAILDVGTLEQRCGHGRRVFLYQVEIRRTAGNFEFRALWVEDCPWTPVPPDLLEDAKTAFDNE